MIGRARRWWSYMRRYEPLRVRGALIAVAAVAAVFGVRSLGNAQALIDAVLGPGAAAATAEAGRRKVWSDARHRDQLAAASGVDVDDQPGRHSPEHFAHIPPRRIHVTTPQTTAPRLLLGRNPVLYTALIAVIIQTVSSFVFELSIEQQGTLNAVAAAAFGIIASLGLVAEKVVPTILGFLQAVLALGLSFGLQLDPEQQSVLLSLAAAVLAMFARTQVTAPDPNFPFDA